MILLSQWYTPKNESRLAENSMARYANESLRLFSNVTYLNGDKKRWAFGEFFDLAASQFPGEVCVVANTDITFDDPTCWQIASLCRRNRIVTLTRWDDSSSPRMLGHLLGERFYSGTQDAWAFIGGAIPRLDKSVPMGVVGCDQVVVGWAAKSGCEVLCPSLSIRTFHVHEEPNKHEGEATMVGDYGYPELTTSTESKGRVVCHSIPFTANEDGTVSSEVIITCQP